MTQCEQRAAGDIEFLAEWGWAEHCEDRHSVHVVGDGFERGDREAAPAFAGGGLQALEDVEEGDGGCWIGGGWRRKCCEDYCLWVSERDLFVD